MRTRKRQYDHVDVKLEEVDDKTGDVVSKFFSKKPKSTEKDEEDRDTDALQKLTPTVKKEEDTSANGFQKLTAIVKKEGDDSDKFAVLTQYKEDKKIDMDEIYNPTKYDDIDIEWVKSLENKEYFEFINKITVDSRGIWEKPLNLSMFETENKSQIPKNFIPIYTRIRLMRSKLRTPVDMVGTAAIPITVGERCGILKDMIKPINYRLQVLVGVMLSAQTKDETTAQGVYNIVMYCIEELGYPEGLSLEALLKIDEEVMAKLIHSVGFHTRKAKFVTETAKILKSQYNGDIPTTVEGLLGLPGVGPKMSYLVLHKAWGKLEGICVDVHVHRLSRMFHWVDPKKCKTPEHTRKALQEWLPRPLWYEINTVLVGFGQVICTSRRRRCDICLANTVCNAADKKLVSKSISTIGFKLEEIDMAQRGDFSQWLEFLKENADTSISKHFKTDFF